MRRSNLISVAICAVVLCSAAHAQENYGFGTPGLLGNIPSVDSNQAWVGRPDFEISIENSAAFTQVFYLISGAPAATNFLGIPIWVDLNGLFEVSPGMVPTDITDMSGNSSLVLPLPNLPILIGFKIYAQGLALDIDPMTGLPSSTDGVEITFTAQPQVAVSTSVGGSTDPFYLVNPQTMSLDFQGGSNFTNNVYGNMTYTDQGRHLYIASSITASLNHVDLTGPAPVFSNVATFPTTNGSNSGCWETYEDTENRLLWILATNDVGSRQLFAVDIDMTSPSYGVKVAQTTTIPQGGFPEVWALSNDGKTAAVLAALSGVCHIVDTDPTSATFLQVLQSLIVPGNGFFNSTVEFSPDDDTLYVVSVPLGGQSEIARYRFSSSDWIDHNPTTTFIVDNIGPNSVPPVLIGNVVPGIAVAPEGDTIFVSSSGTGQVTRIDFAGGTWTDLQATGASPSQVWEVDVNFDGTTLAGPSWSPPQLNFWDAATMTFIGSVALPSGSNIYNVNWR